MAELSREEAIDLLAWMAQVLVKATLAGWQQANRRRAGE